MGNAFNATYAVYILLAHKYLPPGGVCYQSLFDNSHSSDAVHFSNEAC